MQKHAWEQLEEDISNWSTLSDNKIEARLTMWAIKCRSGRSEGLYVNENQQIFEVRYTRLLSQAKRFNSFFAAEAWARKNMGKWAEVIKVA